MAKVLNGRLTLILAGAFVTVMVGVGSWFVVRAEGHYGLLGHPVLKERVETIHDTVDEIRADVKELLRRK